MKGGGDTELIFFWWKSPLVKVLTSGSMVPEWQNLHEHFLGGPGIGDNRKGKMTVEEAIAYEQSSCTMLVSHITCLSFLSTVEVK